MAWRATKRTIVRGLAGRRRRRIKAILRRVVRWGEWSSETRSGAAVACAARDARRIADAGLGYPVVSQQRAWRPGGIGEVTIFMNAASTLEYARPLRFPVRGMVVRSRTAAFVSEPLMLEQW